MRRTARVLLVSTATVTAVAALVATATAAPPGAYPRPGRTELASLSSNGKQSNDESSRPAISANGRFVAFDSRASNLVPGDTNQVGDVFVRDRRGGRTVRVSVASTGAQAIVRPLTFASGHSSISADGRYVAFQSNAINLVPGDTNNTTDVFAHDLKTGRTTRVSVSSSGVEGSSSSNMPAISSDGRFVAFASNASNLVAKDSNGVIDVFVHDMRTGKTVRASVLESGREPNGWSGRPSISANGRYVAFETRASNLAAGTTEMTGAVVVRDIKTGKITQASVASDGSPPAYGAIPSCVVGIPPLVAVPTPVGEIEVGGLEFQLCTTVIGGPAISDDGRYVVFASDASNLVPNDANYNPRTQGWDVFVHDMTTGRTDRVSVNSDGQERHDVTALVRESGPVISGNGRVVAYVNDPQSAICSSILRNASESVDICGAFVSHTFVYDRLAGAMLQTSVSMRGGQPSPGSCTTAARALGLKGLQASVGSLSRDGRYATFRGMSPDHASGDKNGLCDVFVRDLGPMVGNGGFGSSGGSSRAPFEECVTSDICLPPLAASSGAGNAEVAGADLIGARVVPRAQFGDLFVRLDVAQMQRVAGAPAGGVLYGARFAADGQRYEVRAQRVPGADFDAKGGASFGLFRQDPVTGVYGKVATLKGGYGTIGDSVVVAVPLREVGLASGDRLSGVEAFTAVGTFVAGATKVLDAVRLAR